MLPAIRKSAESSRRRYSREKELQRQLAAAENSPTARLLREHHQRQQANSMSGSHSFDRSLRSDESASQPSTQRQQQQRRRSRVPTGESIHSASINLSDHPVHTHLPASILSRRNSNSHSQQMRETTDMNHNQELKFTATTKTGEEKKNDDDNEPEWRKKLKLVLPHVVLVIGTVVYAVAGAAVFYIIERPNEVYLKTNHSNSLRLMQDKLLDTAWDITVNSPPDLTEEEFIELMTGDFDNLVKETFHAFEIGLRPEGIANETDIQIRWSFMAAVFFTTTVITTIGYGQVVPVTNLGKAVCIAYALFGIPLTLITIADLGKFVSLFIIYSYKKIQSACSYVAHKLSCGSGSDYQSVLNQEQGDAVSVKSKTSIGGTSTRSGSSMLANATVPASFVLFILLAYTAVSAVAFTWIEPWSFLNSFYFFFITMVTVGFGDLMPEDEEYYLISVMFIFIGLVLTTMCIDLVGSDYIQRIHYMGRHMQLAKDAFNILGGKASDMQGWLKQMRKQYGEDFLIDENKFLAEYLAADGPSAFEPPEMAAIRYIDQLASTTTGTIDDYASVADTLDL